MNYRMQIVMDSQSRQDLLWLAEDANTSASGMIRSLVIEKAKSKKKPKKKNAAKMMLEIAERAEKENWAGSVDGSTNDDYIYR